MFRSALPIIYIAVAVGLFFTYIQPEYETIQGLRAEEARFDDALAQAKQLQALKDALTETYNQFSAEDIDRLNTMLPDAVDNVGLALDLDALALSHDMRIESLEVGGEGGEESSGAVSAAEGGAGAPPARGAYQTATIQFELSGAYEDFTAFLRDVEKSLRIVDVVGLSFSGAEEGGDTQQPTYKVIAQTYWLE